MPKACAPLAVSRSERRHISRVRSVTDRTPSRASYAAGLHELQKAGVRESPRLLAGVCSIRRKCQSNPGCSHAQRERALVFLKRRCGAFTACVPCGLPVQGAGRLARRRVRPLPFGPDRRSRCCIHVGQIFSPQSAVRRALQYVIPRMPSAPPSTRAAMMPTCFYRRGCGRRYR